MRGKQVWVAAATVAMIALGAAPASAETIYGVTDTDKLVTFDSATPGTITAPVAIGGLQAGETVKGIDFRPATLQLYALGSTGRVYKVNLSTGAATQVGSGALALTGTDFGLDFNPTVDRLRIVSDSDQNLRVNPNDGSLAATDAPLNGPQANPRITAVAYTNNAPASQAFPAAPSTTLFDIDADSNTLYTQTPPNDGTLVPVGALGVDINGVAGFDISTAADGTTNTAYAVLRAADTTPRLYSVNLTSGAATAVGATGGTDKVKDIAIAPPVPAFAVLTSGTVQGLSFVRADLVAPPTTPTPITGLQVGERIVGIDKRPNGNLLYGVTNQSRVYSIATTGAATAVAGTAFTPAISGATFGVDVNPVADAIRVVSDTGKSSRVSPSTGATLGSDTDLSYLAGDPNASATPKVTGAGYTNSVTPAPAATTLFDVDTGVNALVTQGNPDPNDGVLKTVGAFGVDPTESNGFDIAPRYNHQFAAFQTAASGPSSLYAVNVASTAAATLAPANGGAVLIGVLTLPAGVFAEGLALVTDSSPVPAATPTATATYYPLPTVTPTATSTPTPRKTPGLSGKVRPKRDTQRPYRYRTTGKVKRPSGVSAAAGCKGKVRVRVKRGAKRLSNKRAAVKSNCKFSSRVRFKSTKRFGKRGSSAREAGTLRFRIRFLGNSRLLSRTINRSARYTR